MSKLNIDYLAAHRSIICWPVLITILAGILVTMPALAHAASNMAWPAMGAKPGMSAMPISEKFCSGDECICLDCSDRVEEEHVHVSPPPYYEDVPHENEKHGPPPCQNTVPHEKHHVSNTSERSYDTGCGIRCWYWRLRKGYCGRGCDYYQFRSYDYRNGQLEGTSYADCKH